MAGPAKQRAQAQKQQQQQAARSKDSSSASRDPTQRSIPKFDGNKDPHGHGAGVMEYTRPNDLKNLSEFLGMGGWYTARGVSANAFLHSAYACVQANPCHAPTSCKHCTLERRPHTRWMHGINTPSSTHHLPSTSCTLPICSRKILHLHSSLPISTSSLYNISSLWNSLSFIMSSKILPMYQDIYSYRPRHANMDFNSRDPQLTIPSALPQRPKNFNSYGKETTIMLNTFNVVKAPNTIVHQYDVAFSGDSKDYSKRKLLQKIWNSKVVKDELGEPKNLWVYDGNKLAW